MHTFYHFQQHIWTTSILVKVLFNFLKEGKERKGNRRERKKQGSRRKERRQRRKAKGQGGKEGQNGKEGRRDMASELDRPGSNPASVNRCVTMGKLLKLLTSVSGEYHLCCKNVYKDEIR